MAKIRGIKPDLWTDVELVEASAFARLLFIGMWNFACDNGHLQDKSRQIKMRILPTDDVNCADLLDELRGLGLIERGDGWITIPNLRRHQRVDVRYFTTCDKPGCVDPPEKVAKRESRRVPAGHPSSAQRVPTVVTSSAHGDGDGDGDGDKTHGDSDLFEEWWKHYPRKAGKGQARRAHKTALTKTDQHTLLAAADRVADHHKRAGTETRFIPHPATWLNGERWADDLEPAKHANTVTDGSGTTWDLGEWA